MLRRIFSHVFPVRCLVCGACTKDHISGVCPRCASLVEPVPRPVCKVCGSPSASEGPCLRCQVDPPPYDRLASAALFAGPLKDMIHAFKYADATYYKGFLARMLYDLVGADVRNCDVITFVPLHWSRMVSRGYNQSAILARELSGMTGVPVGYGILKKLRGTPPQVGLTRQGRERNIRGAFRAQGVAGRAVMVVDDVVTTGYTAREVCGSLKRAGADYVLFASVGRIPA